MYKNGEYTMECWDVLGDIGGQQGNRIGVEFEGLEGLKGLKNDQRMIKE